MRFTCLFVIAFHAVSMLTCILSNTSCCDLHSCLYYCHQFMIGFACLFVLFTFFSRPDGGQKHLGITWGASGLLPGVAFLDHFLGPFLGHSWATGPPRPFFHPVSTRFVPGFYPAFPRLTCLNSGVVLSTQITSRSDPISNSHAKTTFVCYFRTCQTFVLQHVK